jgi:drug/metabolite transporter (DMT)-like permease
VLLDMAVLVNFLFAVRRGEKISLVNTIVFCGAIVGSFFALRAWDTAHLNIAGLLWSLLALVSNGLYIEYASRAKQTFSNKVFWMSLGLLLFGFAVSPGPMELDAIWPLALWFAIATGILNFFVSFAAFSNLKPAWTGTLVLGVTPSILIGSYFITGKVLGTDQLLGIALVLCSVGSMGYLLNLSACARNPA